jgi:hypothetical protein
MNSFRPIVATDKRMKGIPRGNADMDFWPRVFLATASWPQIFANKNGYLNSGHERPPKGGNTVGQYSPEGASR